MNKYCIYVIKSDIHNRIYIGSSSDVDSRLKYHNTGKVFSTKPYRPWRLIYQESFALKKDALKRERQIKSSGLIRKALKKETYHGPIV